MHSITLMAGAAVMAGFTISIFFLRFWKMTRDRFFLFFAIAFAIDGISRLLLTVLNADEYEPMFFGLRLLGFLMIIFAIIDKNLIKKCH